MAVDRYSREYWHDQQVPQLKSDYGFNDDIAELVFARNWEDNHAFLCDLQSGLDELADFVKEIINAANK